MANEKLAKVLSNVKVNVPLIQAAADEVFQTGVKNIFLIGCGGSYSYMMPWKYFLDGHSHIPSFLEIAAELKVKHHMELGKGSVCLFTSKTGDTKEIVQIMEFCKQQGATTVAFVATEQNPMRQFADYMFYTDCEEEYSTHTFFCGIATFLLKILNHNGEFPKYDRFISQMLEMGPALDAARESVLEKCEAYGKLHKDTPWHLVLGSGETWGEAYCYAMCILEEMQWIKTKSIHAAEFFHGTIELVEPGTSVIMMYGEDETRPLMDRAYKFISSITDQILIFDTKGLDMPFDEEFRGMVSPVFLGHMTGALSKVLERERNHSLSIRRYYRQMEY